MSFEHAATTDALVPFITAKHLVPLASSFRSTWLTSSLRALRERGHFAPYMRVLPAKYHEQVTSSVAGFWLPVESRSRITRRATLSISKSRSKSISAAR